MSVCSFSPRNLSVVMPRSASVGLSVFLNTKPKRLLTSVQANPTLLGLLGFLIPYTSTILTLCQFQGALPPYSLVGLTADYYFLGAFAMVIAGIAEFILGNSTSLQQPLNLCCETLTHVQRSHSSSSSFTALTGAPSDTTKTPWLRSHRRSPMKAARPVRHTTRRKASTTSPCMLFISPQASKTR